jgi:tripartite-type tricarboxylate transporter receptor subunit TctC
VPLLSELGKTEADRAALKLYTFGNALGRSVMSTPGVPADRVAALRKAFMEAMQSPEMNAEVKKLKIEIGPMAGDKVATLIDETFKVPPEILKRARSARGY